MDRRSRVVPWWLVALVVGGFAALLILGLTAVGGLSDRLDRARERSEMSSAEREALAEDIRTLRDQLLNEGIPPAVPPPGPDPVPDEDDIVIGERGESGRPPTSAEIGASVARFCALVGCEGSPGADSTVPGPAGADSTVPGPAGADSTVPGPAGADSTVPGPAGADSTVPGPQGPAGADSTVPGPQGPAGADSTVPGPQGEPGPVCPDGNSPIVWELDDPQAMLIGLPAGTYLICPAVTAITS